MISVGKENFCGFLNAPALVLGQQKLKNYKSESVYFLFSLDCKKHLTYHENWFCSHLSI